MLLYIVNTLCVQVFTVKMFHPTKIQNFGISSCLIDRQGFWQYLQNWSRLFLYHHIFKKQYNHALSMLVNTLSADKPLELFQFTLKHPMGAGDNVELMFQSFERKFYGLHLCRHFAHRPFNIIDQQMHFYALPVFLFAVKMLKDMLCLSCTQ